jgi:hypothetical protein
MKAETKVNLEFLYENLKSSHIASMLKSIDDKGAHHIKREYLTIDILDNSYKYSHNGLGYMVINSATEREHFITISNEIASCTCSTFLQYQLPCRHLLFVMKSVINLQPYVAPRWIKQFMVSKVSDREYSESISTQLQESTETNIWNQMGESIHSSNHTSKLIIQTQSEKYNSLKVIFDQISALLCLSGQKEFNRNLAILEKYLVALQLNKSLEPFDPPTSNITQKPPRHPILPNARRSRSISPKQTPSSSNSSSSPSTSSNFVIN